MNAAQTKKFISLLRSMEAKASASLWTRGQRDREGKGIGMEKYRVPGEKSATKPFNKEVSAEIPGKSLGEAP